MITLIKSHSLTFLKGCSLVLALVTFSQCHSSKEALSLEEVAPTNDSTFNSLLWEISGNKLQEPSYLFGTIHLIPEKEFFLSEVAKKKIAKSKRLCLEIDLDDPATITASLKGVMRKGVLLKDLLNADDYTFVIKKLDQNDIPISMVKSLKPLLVSTLLLEKSADEKMLNYESELATLAKQQKKEIIGLETAEFQMAMLDSIPYEEQAKMLVEEARKAEGFSELRQMIRLYKEQNIDAIHDYIVNQSVGFNVKFERILLSNRNDNWIPVISDRASEMSTFFAVGAGHLGGKAGIVRQLRAKGFTVRPIF